MVKKLWWNLSFSYPILNNNQNYGVIVMFGLFFHSALHAILST